MGCGDCYTCYRDRHRSHTFAHKCTFSSDATFQTSARSMLEPLFFPSAVKTAAGRVSTSALRTQGEEFRWGRRGMVERSAAVLASTL